jgi:hypothetical protein
MKKNLANLEVSMSDQRNEETDEDGYGANNLKGSSCRCRNQGCQIFLTQYTKTGKNIPNSRKLNKCPPKMQN